MYINKFVFLIALPKAGFVPVMNASQAIRSIYVRCDARHVISTSSPMLFARLLLKAVPGQAAKAGIADIYAYATTQGFFVDCNYLPLGLFVQILLSKYVFIKMGN